MEARASSSSAQVPARLTRADFALCMIICRDSNIIRDNYNSEFISQFLPLASFTPVPPKAGKLLRLALVTEHYCSENARNGVA